MVNAGLVLEGGGMKGVYTSGVLDFFLDKDLQFASCYGVSMGACNLCSYISGQRGRSLSVTMDYLDDPDYCGLRPMLLTGDLFNAKMAYHDIPMFLNPFDFEKAKEYPGKAYAVMTDIESGRAVYEPINDLEGSMEVVRASASMPLVSKIVEIDGGKYLDGGIADCIPIMRSLHDGNQKNVVIMTKEPGFIRKPFALMSVARVMYRKYPKMLRDLHFRHERYNKVVRFLEREHERGNLFLIRPQTPSEVGRVEKDKAKLEALYQQGFDEAKACYDDMMRYLEK